MLAARLSPHLEKLTKTCTAISRQFILSSKEENFDEECSFSDPLLEEDYTATRGLVHKYGNRALLLLTMNCAAYCRFCTRRRKVSDIEKGLLTDKDINNITVYIKKHPQIKEIIISGGDPLTVPITLKKVLRKLTKLPQIKIFRIGTRTHAVAPALINEKLLKILRLIKNRPLYMMVHFEHPSEITPKTVAAIKKLRSVSTMLLSQSIFLKGVNDSFEVLFDLFSRLIEIGVKPYYIYHCDPVKGAEHFIADIKKEAAIMTRLRKKLSGLAFPTYVIDAPNGAGKIPVPLNFWNCDFTKYSDFDDRKLKT